MHTIPALFLLSAALAAAAEPSSPVGQFQGQLDIGASLRPGSAQFDSAKDAYTVTGGGLNMWGNADAFHFVWKKLSGDFAISAEVRITTGADGGDPHRKAGIVVRQSLAPDSPYIDVILHRSGLTSMQFRTAPAATTEEISSSISAPALLRLERHGHVFEMWLSTVPGEPPQKVGSKDLALHDPVYVGLAVCAHDAGRMETAVFSNVKVESASTPESPQR
jgi:TolB protein